MDSLTKLNGPAAGLLLKVTSGIHSGVSVPLLNQTYRVGSAIDCDFTLSDKDVCAHHLTIKCYQSDVFIEANDGTVLVDGDMVIPVGHGLRASPPLWFQIGNTKVELLSLARTTNKTIGGRTRRLAVGSIVLTLLLTIADYPSLFDFDDKEASLTAIQPKEHTGTAPLSSNAVPGTAVTTNLQRRLAEVGLTALKIETDGRHVTASGSLRTEDQPAWIDVQGWFDRTYGDSYVLTSLVKPLEDTKHPRLNLQAVWFGEVPYLINFDGTKFYKGAALENGWIIKDIRDHHIIARRQNDELVLGF